ncbi:ATP-binding protein [Acrocarpospora catenulata]|uniref:ATP-binding protein n=1 Tax=Acrocarpospora catenulata TaxID=2836182 RepID=UPI002023A176|nr:tetratricopeptide repeat protein [Acrocarpospora catenulata]
MNRDPHSEHVNSLGGTVHGPAVQARDIIGGIHIHQAVSPMPTPRQLPPSGTLINRLETLAFLDRAHGKGSRSGSPTIVVVSGPAGVGKTAISLNWAHRNSQDFPDGQLYADLRGHATDPSADPAEVLGQFIRAFGIAPDRIPGGLVERAALYQSLVTARRLVVVLDDALSAAQVRPLLPASGGSVVLVTSRWRLAGLMMDGARGIQLERLDVEAALDLLRHRLGDDRVGGELTAAKQLVDLCARVPLALSVAAARLATRPRWPLTEMVEALAQENQRLSALSVEDDMTIRAALTLSYQNLSPPEAARLYRLLGLFPGATFDSAAASALVGLPSTETRRLLGVLTDANLLDDVDGGSYRFHDLVRLHAKEMAEAEEPIAVQEEAMRRAVDWFLRRTRMASHAAAPYRSIPVPDGEPGFADAAQALDWMDREFRNLRATALAGHARGLHVEVWNLVDAMWPLFLHRGFRSERLEIDRLGLAAAQACGDANAHAKMLNRTALSLRTLGRWDEAAADLRYALDIWRGLGNTYRIGDTNRQLGHLEMDRDRPQAAITIFEAAVDSYRAAGEPRRVALAMCDLGRALTESGRAGEAVPHLTAAIEMLARESDPYNHARALILLGRARWEEPSVAEDLLIRGLAAMEELGSLAGQSLALRSLGEVALSAGRRADARQYLERAREFLAHMSSDTDRLDRLLSQLD